MPSWLAYPLAIAALVLIAPLIAWLGHKHGRKVKGGVMLTSVLLGFGIPFDPPRKHLIEAAEGEVKGGPESGDPPDPDVAGSKPSGG